MSGNTSLSEFVAEALSRAEHICTNLSEKIEVHSLTLKSKLPFKALSLREVFLHRFADQSLCAANALHSNHPISAATLTRGTMETFSRLDEANNVFAKFFNQPDLGKLDDFLMNRLFGAKNRDEDWPIATNILTSIAKTDKLIPHFRENYDRLSEIAHPNYLGGIGTLQTIDLENHKIILGDVARKERVAKMIAPILIGNQIGFESVYNAMETSVRDLNDLLESGELRH